MNVHPTTRRDITVFLLCVSAAFAFFSVAGIASAQLTPQKLLGPAVAEYGPQYADAERAFKAFQAKDYPEARKILQALKKEHPELAPADDMMAVLYLSVGRRNDAEKAIEQAIVSEPNDPEAFVLLGDLALLDGRLTIADLGFDRARRLLVNVENNAHRLRNLKIRLTAGSASLAEARGQFDLAKEELDQWIALDPKNPVAWGSLGRVEFRRQDYRAAMLAFTKLKEIDKQAPPVEIAMGRLYSDEGKNELAQQQMDAAIKKSPNDNRVRLTVAEWALDNGLLDMAQQNVDAALKIDNNSVGAQVLGARIARTQGKPADAESTLTKAVLRFPNSFSITNELARALAVSPDKDKRAAGLDYARRNFQVHQRSLNSTTGREAAITYGWLLFQNGRASEAEAAIATLSSGATLTKEDAYYVGKIYAENGKTEVAIGALKAALAAVVPFPHRAEAEQLLQSLTGEGK